ncbi:glycosyltransferase family 2 protein [Flavobacterium sp. KACC 22763]|uniref:glycosyltransferase family 2 protein n=1 Tax=Flavobacterium sp. KACC 22763 TaxID=3025668 RepID=UPI0023661608|nr:glycosyltransferase family 2 protein [Flavobacterium sp. KACC 22763]WDF62898.1 glycosyltransferase family 2 protein [Flavobacterium sp. KACC 22763]
MSDLPLVSIIIPCYNHEKYVLNMLKTVLQDDYSNKELIIINDGSSDKSHGIISEWIENNNQHSLKIVYKNRENRGLCKTLNELIDLSKGKYLIPLPSDDLLVSGSILKRVTILENNPHKKALISDSLVIDENDKVIMDSSIVDYNKGDKSRFLTDDAILLCTLISPQISGPSIIINREIFDIIGRYKENLIAEDWYFYQRAAAHNLLIFEDLIGAKYRVHSNNSSGVAVKRSTKMAWTIVLTYWYNWKVMPSFKYKIIALKELAKWSARYLYYKTV